MTATADWMRSLQGQLEASRASPHLGSTRQAAAGTPDARPHTSLLATPASRHTGGRLMHHPSPSTLTAYESRLEAEAGYSYRRPLLQGAAATGGAAGLPAPGARFTPRDPSPFRQQQPSAVAAVAALAGGRGRKNAVPAGQTKFSSSCWASIRSQSPALRPAWHSGDLETERAGSGFFATAGAGTP